MNERKSLAQTRADNGASKELMQQLAVDVRQLLVAASPWWNRLALRFDTRYALWNGQNDDGVKTWEDAFPWPGASDARVRLAEEIIRDRAAIRSTALAGKRVQARALQPGQTGDAQVASAFMRALLYVQAGPMLRDETELGWSFTDTYGAAVMGCYWRQETRVTSQAFDMREIMAAAQKAPEAAMLAHLLADSANDSQTIPALAQVFPGNTDRQIQGFLRRLRETGQGELRAPRIVVNQPQWQAMRPFIDCFFDPSLHDLTRAPLIVCREMLGEAEAYDRVTTEGWDEKWVDELMMRRGKTSVGGMDPLNWSLRDTSGVSQYSWVQDTTERVEVLRAFYFVRERGGMALYQTVMHHDIKDTAGMHVLMDYGHGAMPFHGWRFERGEREICSSRGVPEIVMNWQNQEKDIHDALRDRTSMEVIPTLEVPHGRAGSVLIGPGQQIEKRRDNDHSFLHIGQLSATLPLLDAKLRRQICSYFGLFHPEVDPIIITAHRQQLANDTLADVVPMVDQTFALSLEYTSAEERAALAGPSAARLTPGFRWDWTFDVRSMDPEFAQTVTELIGKIIPLDKGGRLNPDEIIAYLVESIHPDLAERLLSRREDSSLQQVAATQHRIMLALLGIEPPDNSLPGGNPELQTQAITQMLQSPRVQQLLKDDPTRLSALLVERELAMRAFAMQQQQNAFTGRVGQPSLTGGDGTGLPASRGIEDLAQLGMGELTGGQRVA